MHGAWQGCMWEVVTPEIVNALWVCLQRADGWIPGVGAWLALLMSCHKEYRGEISARDSYVFCYLPIVVPQSPLSPLSASSEWGRTRSDHAVIVVLFWSPTLPVGPPWFISACLPIQKNGSLLLYAEFANHYTSYKTCYYQLISLSIVNHYYVLG